MKTIFLILILLISNMKTADAQVVAGNGLELCFTGTSSLGRMQNMNFEDYMNEQAFQAYKMNQVSCERIDTIRFGLSTAVFTLTLGSIYVSATGIGVPVSVGIGATSATLGFINFLVGQIDCDENKEVFKQKVTEAVCEILNQSTTVVCNPSQVKITEIGDPKLMCKNSSNGHI